MLVSNWAQNYWAVSTVAKKTPYDFKSVFGRVVEPFFVSKDLDEGSLMDTQKLILATTPHQGRLASMILKTLYEESQSPEFAPTCQSLIVERLISYSFQCGGK